MSAPVLYLSAEETQRLLHIDVAMAIAEDVFRLHSRDQVIWPEPMLFRLHDTARRTAYRVKAAELPETPVVGVRVTGYHLDANGMGSGASDSTRFVILSDPESARPLAIVDEHWTYNARTSASAVVAVRHLAKEHVQKVAIVGSGTLAETCVRMLARFLAPGQVSVYSRRPESRESFAARLAAETSLSLRAAETAEEAVDRADVVITATSAQQVLVEEPWLAPGVTVVALGRGELSPDTYARVDKIVVDDWAVVQESPDIHALMRDGYLRTEDVYGNMGEVVAGLKGRRSDQERILVRSDGLVSQDVAICYHVYQEARRNGYGVVHEVG